MTTPSVEVYADADALASEAAGLLSETIRSAQNAGRVPNIVLTGGTIAAEVYRRLAPDAADWHRVVFWFGDERYVPAGHPDRNDQQARDAFLDRLDVPAANIRSMPTPEGGQPMTEAADGYAASLPDEPFDLVLLGVGPDGHVASLFPGFPHLHETERGCVEVLGSPKPPPERISLTFPALQHTRAVWFLASGAGKADAVGRALADDGTIDETPARGVQDVEDTRWLLDHAAAADLS